MNTKANDVSCGADTAPIQQSAGFVIQCPENGLLWSARDARCVSLRGDFSTYSTKAKAESAIRRTTALKHRGMVVAQIKFRHGMAYAQVVPNA